MRLLLAELPRCAADGRPSVLSGSQTDSTLLIPSIFHESWHPSRTSRPFRSSRSAYCPCSRPQLACSPYRSTGPRLRSVCSPWRRCTTQSHSEVARNSKSTQHFTPIPAEDSTHHSIGVLPAKGKRRVYSRLHVKAQTHRAPAPASPVPRQPPHTATLRSNHPHTKTSRTPRTPGRYH